jgi:hypothetical protein
MMHPVRAMRVVLAVAVCAAFASVGSVARADLAAQGCSAQAVVVVEPGPAPVSICFDGSISGLEALQLAGANPVTYGFSGQGAAVCQLYGVGNPADQSCLVGPDGQYWAYYRAAPGASGWTYSRGGASTTTVTDGSVEGWRYGTGGAPGFVSFCSVVSCAPPATDPPPSVTVAPAPAPAETPPPAGPGPTAAPPDTTRPGAAKSGDGANAGGKDGETKASGTTSPPSTTDGRGRGGSTRSRRAANVEIAAGPGTGGGDSGSPVGVVVAGIVLVVGAGAAVWFRRRRQGPAPG